MRVLRSLLLVALFPAMAAAQSTTQVVEYYTTDAIGSVRAVTKQVNGQWQVVARRDFMPFGEEVSPQVPPPYKRLFTGKERDAETGQDYFGARYHRANLARFTTVDPELNVKEALVDPQRWNRYAYVRNNPLRYVDPDGREIVCATAGCLEARAQAANTAVVMASGAAKGIANGVIGAANLVNFFVDSALAFTPYRVGQVGQLPMTPTEQMGAMIADAVLVGVAVVEVKIAADAARSSIQFGRTENQVYHTFRHVEAAGLDRGLTAQAITKDLASIGKNLPYGLLNRTVAVGDAKVTYSAFKLKDGTINVGRITLPQ